MEVIIEEQGVGAEAETPFFTKNGNFLVNLLGIVSLFFYSFLN